MLLVHASLATKSEAAFRFQTAKRRPIEKLSIIICDGFWRLASDVGVFESRRFGFPQPNIMSILSVSLKTG